MQLRPDQEDVFRYAAQVSFRKRVATYLRKHLPQHTVGLPDEELTGMILDWQTRAAAYGVVTERAMAKWCLLSMMVGPAFHNEPEVAAYLRQAEPPPSVKIDTLLDALYVRVRQGEVQSGRESF